MNTHVKPLVIALISVSIGLSAHAQTLLNLYSGMNGTHPLEGGGQVPFWGFGFIGQAMTLPATTLRFEIDEEVMISMVNLSPEAHTIHLHGLDVDMMNDGVPHTSANVFPNDTGMYVFASAWPGTYFYHCHVTTTLHLTMGMYGLIIIEYPENQIFDGPIYDKDYAFLATDLEIETNEDPFGSFPFHEIRPDYFMLNGHQGTQITANEDRHMWFEEGDLLLLRLTNLGYTKVVYELPEALNAVVYTSDGRPLPEPFSTELLEVYPGERFSVVVAPPAGYSGAMLAHYYSMINHSFLHTNEVPFQFGVNPSVDEPKDITSTVIYPNPATSSIHLSHNDGRLRDLTIHDASGRVVSLLGLHKGNDIDVIHLTPGMYYLHDRSRSETYRFSIVR